MLTFSFSASCRKKKYISPTSIALPCDHSSVVWAPGHVKWKSTIVSLRLVMSWWTCAWTLLGGICCSARCTSWLVNCSWQVPSAVLVTVYDAGDGGKKDRLAASLDTEHEWLQSMQPIAVDMMQPIYLSSGGQPGTRTVALSFRGAGGVGFGQRRPGARSGCREHEPTEWSLRIKPLYINTNQLFTARPPAPSLTHTTHPPFYSRGLVCSAHAAGLGAISAAGLGTSSASCEREAGLGTISAGLGTSSACCDR